MYAQTAIDAALKLRLKTSSVDEISQINIGTTARGKSMMAGDAEKWHPNTRESADHSLPYVVAVALMYGSVEVRHFADEYLQNHNLLNLVQRIMVEETAECNNLYPDAMANRVELVTRTGETFSELVQYHRGHHRNPLSDKETEEKFHSLSRVLLSPPQRKELLSLLWNLEQVEDVGKPLKLLKI
jgi:2-methylcitrate dehydratase